MGNAKLQYVQGRPIFTNINEHKNQYPYLTKNIDTDVCIIVGGITGAITFNDSISDNIINTYSDYCDFIWPNILFIIYSFVVMIAYPLIFFPIK